MEQKNQKQQRDPESEKPYSERSAWKDVQPLSQSEFEQQIVSIDYSKKYKDVYSYFRAMLKTKEKSSRAFNLIEDVIELNPANYTAWQYRREIIKALNVDLQEELLYVQNVIKNNPKNYQVWHHRQTIVKWKNDSTEELKFVEFCLEEDPKNYHAWQHRQWVNKTFNLFDKELSFVEYMIEKDIYNNSAWNHRFFTVSNTTGFPDYIIQRELGFAMDKIKIIDNNESPWNYLRGILVHDKRGLSGNSLVSNFCENLYKSGSHCCYLYSLIIDICNETVTKSGGNAIYNSERAIELCGELESKYDKIRANYWKFITYKFLPPSEEIETPPELSRKHSRASRNSDVSC